MDAEVAGMGRFRKWVILGSLPWLFAGCGGGHQGGAPAITKPGDPNPKPGPSPITYTFDQPGPHANPLPHDPQDEARTHAGQPYRDGAAVLVYADHQGRTYVLLARRDTWLSSPGTWAVFGGSVETTDLDTTRHRMSFSRAAEHELYEESATVYRGTDAVALRACRSHMKTTFNSPVKFRTFFSRQAYIPRERFVDGYQAAKQKGNAYRKFWENDDYLWVQLDELQACAAAGARTYRFTDADGTSHQLNLLSGFCRTLFTADFIQALNNLP